MAEAGTPKTLTIDVIVPKRDDITRAIILDTEQKPVPEKVLGTFVFRIPNLRQLVECQVRSAQLTRGAPVDTETATLAEALTNLPYLCLKAPDGWSWDDLQPEDATALMAVYADFNAAWERFRKG